MSVVGVPEKVILVIVLVITVVENAIIVIVVVENVIDVIANVITVVVDVPEDAIGAELVLGEVGRGRGRVVTLGKHS